MKKKIIKPNFYKKVVNIPIYGGKFIIVFSDDTEKVSKIVKIHPSNIGEIYGMTFHNFLYGGWESFCVCFNFWTKFPITLGTIAHEINHAGNRVLSARDFAPDWNNDEAECYLKGWMADEVMNFMKKCDLV